MHFDLSDRRYKVIIIALIVLAVVGQWVGVIMIGRVMSIGSENNRLLQEHQDGHTPAPVPPRLRGVLP